MHKATAIKKEFSGFESEGQDLENAITDSEKYQLFLKLPEEERKKYLFTREYFNKWNRWYRYKFYDGHWWSKNHDWGTYQLKPLE